MKRLYWSALAVIAVVPFLAGIHNPLVYDDRTLLDNRWLVHEAGPASVFQHDFWYGTRHEGSELYRPLTVLSLAWNFRALPSKEGVRAVNIALHVAATLSVAWLLSTLAIGRAAWIGAALFAVHPLGSEAVLWAVGRAEMAAAILGIVAFVQFTKLDRSSGLGGIRLTVSVAAFFLALCFKESAATWLVIGAAWLTLGPRDGARSGREIAARAAIYVAAFAVFFILRGSVVGWQRHDVPFVDNPLVAADATTRVANAVLIFARYVAKMVWPGTLSIEYGFDQIPVVPLFPWAGLAAAAIIVGVVAGFVVLYRRGKRAAAFLAAFVPCAFVVTGNLLFPIGTIFAERLTYLPLIGFCGLAGMGISAIRVTVARRVVIAVLLLAGTWRTAERSAQFRSVATLSEATAAASPRSVKALFNAARTRIRQGKSAEAVPLLERAILIWPDYTRARELLEQARAGASAPPAATDPDR